MPQTTPDDAQSTKKNIFLFFFFFQRKLYVVLICHDEENVNYNTGEIELYNEKKPKHLKVNRQQEKYQAKVNSRKSKNSVKSEFAEWSFLLVVKKTQKKKKIQQKQIASRP